MNNHSNHAEEPLVVNCYKCTAGCIHLEYSNVMLTFTQEQFLDFAQTIGETYRTLLEERRVLTEDDPFAGIEELAM